MRADHASMRGGPAWHIASAIIAIVLTNVMVSKPAAAQEPQSIFRAENNWSEDEFAQALKHMPSLDSERQAILTVLRAEYTQAFGDELAAAREAMDLAHEAGRSDMYVAPSVTHPWRDAADSAGVVDIWIAWPIVADMMRTEFERDVREVLAGDVRAAWDAEVRALRRARELPKIREERRSRYALDIVPLVADVPLSQAEASRLAEARSKYELACEAALIEWQQARVLGRRSYALTWMREDRTQPLKDAQLVEYDRINERIGHILATIRDVHIASAESMLAALDEHRADLQDRLDRAWFEVVFLPSPVELAADALLDDGALDDAQSKAVASIRGRYAAALAAQHRSIIDAMKRWEEPAEVKRRAAAEQAMIDAGLNSWGPDGPESHHPAEPLLRRRLELARDGCAELRALFSDVQYRSLPLQVRLLLDWPANGG